jgi:hypothetical protein
MNLTEEQRQRVTAWILQGAKLAEVQSRLQSEFNLKLTYMETRFLVDDLKLTPKDPEPPKVPEVTAAEKSPLKVDPTPVPGGVSVSVDQIARPGAIVSGKVTFSDGQKAEWYLDQTGRLGVVPAQKSYKPTQADVQEFQTALQSELAKMGFA